MRVSKIALTYVAGMAVLAVGVLAGTALEDLMQYGDDGTLVLPAIICTAITIGLYLGRRSAPPSASELMVGCFLCVSSCVTFEASFRQFTQESGLLIGLCIAVGFLRTATALGWGITQHPTRPTRARA